MKGVYLLHFDEPIAHAQHYLGYSDDVEARVLEHRKGNGARLPQVFAERSIGCRPARIWRDVDRAFERKLKNRKESPRLCPICSGDKAWRRS